MFVTPVIRATVVLLLAGSAALAPAQIGAGTNPDPLLSYPTTYTNPLSLTDPFSGPAVSCPDPAIIKQSARLFDVWYLYCTGDPLNSNDKDANGNLKNHLISTLPID